MFNIVHTWAKDNVKHDKDDVEPVRIFLSGSEGTGKSPLVKVIYEAVSKILFYYSKESKKSRVTDSELELTFLIIPNIVI